MIMRSTAALLPLLICACATAPTGDGVVEAKPYVEVSAEPERLSCFGREKGAKFGSRMARTPVFVAPGGRRSAYAEVIATATEWEDGARGCRNVSRLYLSDGGEFGVVFEQDPGAEGQTGNSLELIDWSADGSLLLMELTLWTYPTDVVNPLIVLYDASGNMTRQLPIEAQLKERYTGKCFVGIRAAGFDPNGDAVVETGPHGRDVPFPAPDCTREHGVWAFNEAQQRLRQLAASFRPTRYASVRQQDR